MKVILFGATGMVGHGVLRECLLDDDVERVLVVGRTSTSQRHPKLQEVIHADFTDFSTLVGQFQGYDACFFCLGVSSIGLKEAEYRRVTYDITMAAARAMPAGLTFVYVSGAGTDSTEEGRTMWARVKGQTENALLASPLNAFVFRPGFIQPRHGIVSKTRWYRALYTLGGWLYPLLRLVAPAYVTTTETVGRAMIELIRRGSLKRVLASRDIEALGRPVLTA